MYYALTESIISQNDVYHNTELKVNKKLIKYWQCKNGT